MKMAAIAAISSMGRRGSPRGRGSPGVSSEVSSSSISQPLGVHTHHSPSESCCLSPNDEPGRSGLIRLGAPMTASVEDDVRKEDAFILGVTKASRLVENETLPVAVDEILLDDEWLLPWAAA